MSEASNNTTYPASDPPGSNNPTRALDPAATPLGLDWVPGTPTLPLHLLTRLGGYRVDGELGRGGMGIVLKGFDKEFGRPLPLKLILPEFSSAFASIERPKREARSIARLNHPNIVTLYGVGEDQGYHFISMEYLDGFDLADYLRAKGPLPPRAAVGYARAAAAALGYAASQRIIHRDIKRSNLFLTSSGTLKVMDFGLSKELDADRSLTAVEAVIGTPSYLAPEQAAGAKLCHRADIYSLGCTLFTLLSARRPFEGRTAIEIMMKHAREPLPVDPPMASQLGQDIVDLPQWMTAKEPERRPASWEALIKRMDAILLRLDSGAAPLEPRALAATSPASESQGSSGFQTGTTGRTSPYEALVLASLPAKPRAEPKQGGPARWAILGAGALGVGVVVAAAVMIQSSGARNSATPVAAIGPASTRPSPAPVESRVVSTGTGQTASSQEGDALEAAAQLHEVVCLLASQGEFTTAANRLEQDSLAAPTLQAALPAIYTGVIAGFRMAATLDRALQSQSGERFPHRERRMVESTRPGISEPEAQGHAYVHLAGSDASARVPNRGEIHHRPSRDSSTPASYQQTARAPRAFHDWWNGGLRPHDGANDPPTPVRRFQPPHHPPAVRQRTNPGAPRP